MDLFRKSSCTKFMSGHVVMCVIATLVIHESCAEEHWSFVSPQRPEVPTIDKAHWVQNAIDAFVLRQLEAMGLSPSQGADQVPLLRRLSLVIRGFPPTPQEVVDIRSSEEPIQRVIDRWLASPAFGERMAQDWLDAARYADTMGHAADKPRTMWLYRD